jgi:hypothetical protein
MLRPSGRPLADSPAAALSVGDDRNTGRRASICVMIGYPMLRRSGRGTTDSPDAALTFRDERRPSPFQDHRPRLGALLRAPWLHRVGRLRQARPARRDGLALQVARPKSRYRLGRQGLTIGR